MRSNTTLFVWSVVTVSVICCSMVPAESSQKINWAPKTLPLTQLQKRCHFKVLLPNNLRDYALEKSQIVWAARVPEWNVSLPSRQAVCLFFRRKHDHKRFFVIEAKHLGKVTSHENVGMIFAQGYFDVPFRMGMCLPGGTVSGVDFHVAAYGLSDKEMADIEKSLKHTAGRVGQRAKRR